MHGLIKYKKYYMIKRWILFFSKSKRDKENWLYLNSLIFVIHFTLVNSISIRRWLVELIGLVVFHVEDLKSIFLTNNLLGQSLLHRIYLVRFIFLVQFSSYYTMNKLPGMQSKGNCFGFPMGINPKKENLFQNIKCETLKFVLYFNI